MREIIIVLYMLVRHPSLFFKYTIRNKSKFFLVNGTARNIQTKRLVLGKGVRFGHSTRVGFYGEDGGKLQIGDDCYFVNSNSFLVGEDITIGNNCLFASDILVASENHEIEIEEEKPYRNLVCRPVKIGDGCWIGEKAIVLPGVTIGKKCVIGAGAVVTRDIPEYSIAVGNPARVIKRYDRMSKKWRTEKNSNGKNLCINDLL